MEMKEVQKLIEAWQAKGDPPCDHPTLAKERYLGSSTGDKVCTTCGEDFTPHELREMGR